MKSDDAIGGYFEFELNTGVELHEGALPLNSARNCFRYILQRYKPSKMYLPYYICDSIFDVAKDSGTTWEFYALDRNMELS